MLKNKTPGYLSNHILRKHEHPELISGKNGTTSGIDDGYDSDEDPGKQLQKIKDKKKKEKQQKQQEERLQKFPRIRRLLSSESSPKDKSKHGMRSVQQDQRAMSAASPTVEMFQGQNQSDYEDSTTSESERASKNKRKDKQGFILDAEVSSAHGAKNPMLSPSKH
jgi:hypothetical protein